MSTIWVIGNTGYKSEKCPFRKFSQLLNNVSDLLSKERIKLTWHRNKMFAVIGELEPSHQFRMSEHGSHAFARMKIVNGQCLVSTRCGQVDPWSIKHHFYESTIFTIGALESLDVLAISNSVNTDITILTCCQNVLMIVLKWKMEICWQIWFLAARHIVNLKIVRIWDLKGAV